MRTYLYGYNAYQSRLTEQELMTRWSWAMIHPELRRRSLALFAASQDAGHDVGIGGGARNPQSQLIEALRRHDEVSCSSGDVDRRYEGKCYRLKPGMAGYAFPGQSNHETNVLDGYALAIDYVGWEDGWFDDNCLRFGIKNFKHLSEEWHGQPIEFANARSDVNRQVAAGKKLPIFSLPSPPIVPQPTPIPIYQGVPDMFVPIHPRRNSDTRVWPGPLRPNEIVEFGLDPTFFPQNVAAIAMNVTALDGLQGAFLTIWGSGSVIPGTSVLNFDGSNIVNGSYIGPVINGKFKLRATSAMNVICDITGYWTT